MAVSRFFKFPIQNNFSENQNAHQNPLSRVSDPSGVVGYMRKQESKDFGGLKSTKCANAEEAEACLVGYLSP